MKAHTRKRRPSRRTTPWFVLATIVGTFPTLHAAAPRPKALPIDRRITLEPQRVQAALQHVKIWTPSETLPLLRLQDSQAGGGSQTADAQPVFRFNIAAGPLTQAIREFEQLTGLRVELQPDVIHNLTTDGVSGTLTAAQALDRLLAGTSLNHKFKDASTVVIEIRLESAAVNVTGSLNRIPSTKYAAPLTRDAADDSADSAHAHRGAGRDDADRSAAERSGHHHAGRRRRRRVEHERRHVQHARVLSANNSLFVDGVRDDGLVGRDVYNLEQIEVFSGPTGSDVGRTNAAGYVNLTSKTPNLDRAEAGTLSYGSGDQVRATVDVNQRLPIGEPRHVPGQRRRARQRALAGRRHRRPRLRRAGKPCDCAVDRLRPRHADASQRVCASSCVRTTWPTTVCPRPPLRSGR